MMVSVGLRGDQRYNCGMHDTKVGGALSRCWVGVLACVLAACSSDDGASGKDGGEGTNGVDGNQGPKGDKGEPGDPGPEGPEGPAGPPGASGPSGLTTVCGATNTSNGNLGGWEGAKAMCETTCGSPSAHMCVAAEVMMSAQLGVDFQVSDGTELWYGTGEYAQFTTTNSTNCGGWNGSAGRGPVWVAVVATGGFPYYAECSELHPVLCCDG